MTPRRHRAAAEVGCQGEVGVASLALHGDGGHRVSLDSVVATMRRTGGDMAVGVQGDEPTVNFIEC